MILRDVLIKLFELFIITCLLIFSIDIFLINISHLCYFIENLGNFITKFELTFSIKNIFDLIVGIIIIIYTLLTGLLLIRNLSKKNK